LYLPSGGVLGSLPAASTRIGTRGAPKCGSARSSAPRRFTLETPWLHLFRPLRSASTGLGTVASAAVGLLVTGAYVGVGVYQAAAEAA
jgi:hypothetical protein